ncbi:unnamed protein product, partial [Didymodactylos carnosus]
SRAKTTSASSTISSTTTQRKTSTGSSVNGASSAANTTKTTSTPQRKTSTGEQFADDQSLQMSLNDQVKQESTSQRKASESDDIPSTSQQRKTSRNETTTVEQRQAPSNNNNNNNNNHGTSLSSNQTQRKLSTTNDEQKPPRKTSNTGNISVGNIESVHKSDLVSGSKDSIVRSKDQRVHAITTTPPVTIDDGKVITKTMTTSQASITTAATHSGRHLTQNVKETIPTTSTTITTRENEQYSSKQVGKATSITGAHHPGSVSSTASISSIHATKSSLPQTINTSVTTTTKQHQHTVKTTARQPVISTWFFKSLVHNTTIVIDKGCWKAYESSIMSSDDVLWPRWKLLLLVLSAYSMYSLSIILGLLGHFIYFLATRLTRFGQNRKIEWNQEESDGTHEKPYYVIVIGGGFSGLGLAIKLKKLNVDNYVIFERRGNVGGTWHDNKYPGCACDVPSNLYSFSFEPYPKWSHFFGRQNEIWKYLEYITDKHNLRQKIQFNTKVTRAQWLDDENQWKVTINNGRSVYSRYLVSAHGPLSDAQFPTNIAGIDQFKGGMFHSAEWDTAYDFKDKRVAVVGTGASSIQLVPEIQKEVKQLYIFQRTPPWIVPRADRKVTDTEKKLFERFPLLQKVMRAFVYWAREATIVSFAYRLPTKYINQQLVKYFLFKQVKDPELRQKLTPTWELGCKRVLLSNDWYPTLQKPNVTLVTSGIKQVNEHSISTYDGNDYEVDTIIWSTGFQVQEFPIDIRGLNDISIYDQWKDTMQAYKGITIPNFPNLFFLLGPNTGLAHNSVLFMIESQLTYIIETMIYMQQNHLKKFLIKQQAFKQYNDRLQAKLKKSVWQSGGCKSWYQDKMGNNTTLWPDFTWSYKLITQHFDHDKYDLFSINDNKKAN